MNPAAVVFLSCLLILCAQGQPGNRSRKCKCLNGYIGRVSQQQIRQLLTSEPIIHEPSVFCPHTEIIIVTSVNKNKCVNPLSPLGKLLLSNKKKHESTGAVGMTTASIQTDTSRSTRLHTTDSAPNTTQ